MTKEILRKFLREEIGVPDFEDDTELINLGFIDSMQAMRLAMFVADEFDIELTQEDMRVENFGSLVSVVNLIDRKKAH